MKKTTFKEFLAEGTAVCKRGWGSDRQIMMKYVKAGNFDSATASKCAKELLSGIEDNPHELRCARRSILGFADIQDRKKGADIFGKEKTPEETAKIDKIVNWLVDEVYEKHYLPAMTTALKKEKKESDKAAAAELEKKLTAKYKKEITEDDWKKFQSMVDSADWAYMMSDDPHWYREGEKTVSAVSALYKKMKYADKDRAKKIWDTQPEIKQTMIRVK